MDLAARYLVLHGRLVYWLPVYRPRYVIHSFVRPSVRSGSGSGSHSIYYSFIHPLIYLLLYAPILSLSHWSFIFSFIHSFARKHSSFTYSNYLFYSHNHSLGWSVVHSIIPTYLIFNPPMKSFINSFIHLISFFLRSFLSTSFIHSFIGVSLGQANLNIKLEKVRLASAIPFLTLLLLIL